MALRGMGTGGCSFALPPAYDDTADLSAFLWVRAGDNPAAGARLLTLLNTARTRGFAVHLGGTVGGSSQASDVVISASSGAESNWGSSTTTAGRGRAIVSGLSDAEFSPLAFSLRGSAAADNIGTSGAMQLHQVWWKGALAGIATTATGSGTPSQGNMAVLLCRDATNLSAFNGWVAEVAVWQGHRMSQDEAMRLSYGASPLHIAPEKLLFCRSFRTGLEAEAGDAPLAMIGGGAGFDALTHPPRLIEAAKATHQLASGDPLKVAETIGLSPASGTLQHRAANARLSTAGRRCLAPALWVPPEHRAMDAGI